MCIRDRGSPVRRLEHAVAGDVVDVPPRRDPDPADLGGQGVGQVVTVQVGRGDDVELVRPRQHLLEGDVGDGVLYEQLVARFPVAVVPAHGHVGKLFPHELVAPVAERPFGELLDVPLVDEGHAAT